MATSLKQQLRKKAPTIIFIALALALIIYVGIEIVEDSVIEGHPIGTGPILSTIISFTQNITGTIATWGYVGIFILMLLEASSLPIPSEVILPFAGFVASSSGSLNLWVIVAVSTIAALAGSLIDYYIGLKGIHLLTRYKVVGKTIVSMNQVQTVAGWFTKYGPIMVFAARLVPVFRTLISFPAGAVKMPLIKFITYTIAGCIVWNIILVYLGYYLGANWREVAGFAHYIVIGIVVVVVVAVIVYFAFALKRKKANAKKFKLID